VRTIAERAAFCVLTGSAIVSPAGAQSDFATTVHLYAPAPGQFVNEPLFNDPAAALGAPVGGGTAAPDNSKVVSLGGFGGSITLGFDHTVLDDARNPMGLDFIVFSNAFWSGGSPTSRWAEPAVIEISRDENGNGLPDDAWFVIPGSSLPDPPSGAHASQQWDDDGATATPPEDTGWYPRGAPSPMTTTGFALPGDLSTGVVQNPNGADGTVEGHWGYAQLSPTMALGDLSGAVGGAGENSLDDPEDDPTIDPAEFYTVPDDPFTVGVDAGSGGGDAFDIAWAVDAETGEPAAVDGFDFIRITNGVNAVGPFGEISSEIGGVADVRAAAPDADLDGDGAVDGADLGMLLLAWNEPGGPADLNNDRIVNGADLGVLLLAWSPS